MKLPSYMSVSAFQPKGHFWFWLGTKACLPKWKQDDDFPRFVKHHAFKELAFFMKNWFCRPFLSKIVTTEWKEKNRFWYISRQLNAESISKNQKPFEKHWPSYQPENLLQKKVAARFLPLSIWQKRNWSFERKDVSHCRLQHRVTFLHVLWQ